MSCLYWPFPQFLLVEVKERGRVSQNVLTVLLQPALMDPPQSLMETRALLPVQMVANPRLVLMGALPQEEDPVEDLVEDVPRKTESVVMDPPLSLMETGALHHVLMEISQNVHRMIVNKVS